MKRSEILDLISGMVADRLSCPTNEIAEDIIKELEKLEVLPPMKENPWHCGDDSCCGPAYYGRQWDEET